MINIVYNIPEAGTNGTAGISNPSRLVENASYFETRLKALQFNGVDQYLRVPDFNPSGEKGYSVFYVYNATHDYLFNTYYIKGGITDNIFDYLRNEGGSTNYYRWYVYQGYEVRRNQKRSNIMMNGSTFISDGSDKIRVWMNAATEIKLLGSGTQYANIDFDDDPTQDLYIGQNGLAADYWEGMFMYFIICKGLMTKKDFQTLWNNSFLKNPDQRFKNDFDIQLFVDFNNPYYDASTSGNGGLKFPDLSPNNHDVFAEGWASLEDLQSSLIDINELRFNVPAGALLDETGDALRDESNVIVEED